MRSLLLAGCLLALAACRSKGAPDPAWPKSAGHVAPETWEEDGGESLEPQHDTMVESSDSGDPEATDAELQALMDQALNAPPPPDDNAATDEMIIIDEDAPPDPAVPAPVP